MADRVEGMIEVAVNGSEWTHVASFENAGPTDTVFVTETEDGITSIIFGDGTHGALPPSGSNIAATYRGGSGSTGCISKRIENASDLRKFWVIVSADLQAAGWGNRRNAFEKYK